jgi:hypothetical protein
VGTTHDAIKQIIRRTVHPHVRGDNTSIFRVVTGP